MRTLRQGVVCLAVATLPGAASGVQVTGTVTDGSGQGVSGALVMLTVEDPQRRTFKGTTAGDGSYSIEVEGPVMTAVTPGELTRPEDFGLQPNYPNPFNSSTVIPFTLPARSHVRLGVYNVLGQRVRTLQDGVLPPGRHKVFWDGRDRQGRGLATGIYFYRLESGGFSDTGRMLLLDGVVAAPGGPGRAAASAAPAPRRAGATQGRSDPTLRVMILGDGVEPYVEHGVGVSGSARHDLEVKRNAAHRLLEGDVVIELSDGPLRSLQQLAAAGGESYSIEGDLGISFEDSSTDLIGLEGLVAISGNLTTAPGSTFDTLLGAHPSYLNQDLASLRGLENLRVVGGTLGIGLRSGVSAASLPSLETVGELSAWPSVASLEGLGSLRHVGSVRTASQQSLRGLGSIRELTGDLVLEGGRQLESLEGLDGLRRVGGDVLLHGLSALLTIEALAELEVVGGDLVIAGNDRLGSLDGLRGLREVGGRLWLGVNRRLGSLRGLDNLERVGALLVADNDSLASLRGLGGLRQVGGTEGDTSGDVIVRGNDVLRTVDGLDGLRAVAGRAIVERNARLESLEGLRGLSQLGEAVMVWENPELPRAEVVALVTALRARGVEGEVTEDVERPVLPVVFADPNLQRVVDACAPDEEAVRNLWRLEEPPIGGFPRFRSLDGLENLVFLKRLTLGWSHYVVDLSPVGYLTQLEYFRMEYNQIRDLSFLESLGALTEIRLEGNQVEDLEPLVANESLGEGVTVDLRHNPLSEEALSVQIPALEARGVTVSY